MMRFFYLILLASSSALQAEYIELQSCEVCQVGLLNAFVNVLVAQKQNPILTEMISFQCYKAIMQSFCVRLGNETIDFLSHVILEEHKMTQYMCKSQGYCLDDKKLFFDFTLDLLGAFFKNRYPETNCLTCMTITKLMRNSLGEMEILVEGIADVLEIDDQTVSALFSFYMDLKVSMAKPREHCRWMGFCKPK